MLHESLLCDDIELRKTDDDDDAEERRCSIKDNNDLWLQVFPYEIIYLRKAVKSKTFVFAFKIFFVLCTVGLSVYAAALMIKGEYVTSDLAVSLVVLLHTEGVIMLFLPFISCEFARSVIDNPDTNNLIAHAIRFDPHVKMKFAFYTHLNLLVLITAVVLYSYGESYHHVLAVLLTGIAYFGPLNLVVSLMVCLIELHRIRIQQFRHEIHECHSQLEKELLNSSEKTNINQDRSSKFSELTQKFRCKYYKIFGLCMRTSTNYGLYILFIIAFGGLYTFGTIYSIYLGQYPTSGLIGFVIVGFFMFLGVGFILTVCNETGV